jgi:hypothetical protein
VPGIELHADFDRDGRLTRSAAERAARMSGPGAVVVPNMDRDRRRLPPSVTDAPQTESDYELVSALSGDDEVLPLEIRAAGGALAEGDTLHLRCSGVMHTRVRLSDETGRIVPHRLGSPGVYELPLMPASGVLGLTLQVRTIAGAPFARVSDLHLGFEADAVEEDRFTLTLVRRDAAGADEIEDEGRFSVAPFILVDRIAPVCRLYMVRSTNNVPSLEDVRRAARIAHVPLVEIDERLSAGDTWIQDQYQHAVMQGPTGWTDLILHLPRLVHENSNATITDNLERVVNGHFRSRDIGLFVDLWDRVLPVLTEDGTVVRVTFRDLESWVKQLRRLEFVTDLFNRHGRDAAGPGWRTSAPVDCLEALLNLDSELGRLKDALSLARTGASEQRLSQLAMDEKDAKLVVDAVKRQFRVARRSADPVIESDLGGQRVGLRVSVARRLLARGGQMHGSENYGGNIESTPPSGMARLGVIILGNAIDPESGRESVDPDLLRVFAKQKKQPIVEIDTSWLKVGHVDEMLAVVPSTRAGGGFAVLHASSRAAVELIRRARRRHLLGLSIADPMRVTAGDPPSGILPRLTMDGPAPVTRLFRGKAWLHDRPRAEYGHVELFVEPPEIYRQLCRAFGTTTDASGWNLHRVGYVPGEGDVRRYPADVTVIELLWAEGDRRGESSNEAFDQHRLEPSRAILRAALPGVDIVPVPVLFDRTHDVDGLGTPKGTEATTAFSPNMVNTQLLNGHLLMPRPYGPRMRVGDAIVVVREAMTALEVPGSIKDRVGRRLIAARRMTRGEYWVERVRPAPVLSESGTIRTSYGGMETKGDVIDVFRDSFPGATAAERERWIIGPHRRHFDAQGWLRDEFSLFRIEDGMVDIFELWAAAVAAELGVRLHFVDSWFYHLRDGEIHCGTNVLHAPPSPRARLTDVWDAPDHAFRAQSIEMPEENVMGVTQ